ncbi:uncharacterized protein NECHADRAFT_87846 [Fusarium vanettenii 77-13-4]|uniref:DUF7704 domain-containing protein n=1 Tax=Fusarium vanettenii (strain ATCC MYA-4622 / CBS 123669 / FGSC 9596 / NRRL 45880 / 77-13-4) TaxID=660122 RepID=C7Z367_FUSV7|nr:uncharacterized protein NECHADRAFT_87846 [Fusarium vanettenii 77-13-4]EEU41779.1 hypothetical protein NECHADRAFT_87846 [Fusarium vanettenii 77-13-4]
MADQIHPIYRAWFLWVDPILTLAGMYGNLFAHDLAVEAFFANYPLIEELKPFLYQIGGMGTSYLVLLVLLQRYTQDVVIWKILHFAILWADFTMLTAIYVAMRHEGTLAISNWRALDWFSIVITGICTVLRALFVLGVGVKVAGGKGKRT